MSSDGRYVVFSSNATNLVPGDTNGSADVFLRDRQNGTTTRISTGVGGEQGNSDSVAPAISDNGRYTVFESQASNLVQNDTNGTWDVFVHDRTTGVTTMVSVSSTEVHGNDISNSGAISADGKLIAFKSVSTNLVLGDTNNKEDVFVRDQTTGITYRVSLTSEGLQGNNHSGSWGLAISADGHSVAFTSFASNLVLGDSNGSPDVFVRDLESGATTRVSVGSGGTQGTGDSAMPSLSPDGRFVSFCSWAWDLVANDANGFRDVFVHDRQKSVTVRISVASNGAEGNAECDWRSSIDAEGRKVVFGSSATNIVPIDTNNRPDVFLHDLQTGSTSLVSLSSAGTQGDRESDNISMSADGRFIAFASYAKNLVAGDTNGFYDVFVRQIDSGALTGLVVAPDRVTGGGICNGTVNLTDAVSVGGATVQLSSNSGAATVPSEVLVTEGNAAAQFEVITHPVISTTTVTITARLRGILRTAALIVRAPILTSLTLNPQIQAGSLATTGRVNLSGPAPAGLVVNLSKTSGAITIPASVTVPLGASFALFDIQTQAVAGPVQAQIVASRGTVQRAAILFLYPTTLESVTIAPLSVIGGSPSVGTVHLSLPAPAGGVNVQLVSLNPAVASVPSVVVVPAGQVSRTFTITTYLVGSTTNVSIRASRNGVSRARVITVRH